jgi:hypothetical protein
MDLDDANGLNVRLSSGKNELVPTGMMKFLGQAIDSEKQ